MWPGNTADVTTLLPVIDRLRQRFGIGRVCIVADRGMISAAAIAGLEERQLEYILGARERGDVLVKKIVMENDDPFCAASDPAYAALRQGRRADRRRPRLAMPPRHADIFLSHTAENLSCEPRP